MACDWENFFSNHNLMQKFKSTGGGGKREGRRRRKGGKQEREGKRRVGEGG